MRDNNNKGNPQDRVPAPEQDSPDHNLLLEPDADEIREDESPTKCTLRQRYICLSDALKLLRNQMSERDALIFIARFYYKLKLKDLESIFRLDHSNISRVAQKAERKLKVRG